MIIGGVDIWNTENLIPREKNNFNTYVWNYGNDVGPETESLAPLASILSCDEDFMPPKTSFSRITPNERKVKNRVLKKLLPHFTETWDSYRVSVRAVAVLGIFLLGVIETEEVTDSSKVFREKKLQGWIKLLVFP